MKTGSKSLINTINDIKGTIIINESLINELFEKYCLPSLDYKTQQNKLADIIGIESTISFIKVCIGSYIHEETWETKDVLDIISLLNNEDDILVEEEKIITNLIDTTYKEIDNFKKHKEYKIYIEEYIKNKNIKNKLFWKHIILNIGLIISTSFIVGYMFSLLIENYPESERLFLNLIIYPILISRGLIAIIFALFIIGFTFHFNIFGRYLTMKFTKYFIIIIVILLLINFFTVMFSDKIQLFYRYI